MRVNVAGCSAEGSNYRVKESGKDVNWIEKMKFCMYMGGAQKEIGVERDGERK